MGQNDARGSRDRPRPHGDSVGGTAPGAPGHPEDDTFIQYSMNVLPAGDAASVGAHAATCGECRERLQQLLAVSAGWESPEGQARLDSVSARIVAAFDAREARASLPARGRFAGWFRAAGTRPRVRLGIRRPGRSRRDV